eukprot:Gb_38016 [translate_table: standard]
MASAGVTSSKFIGKIVLKPHNKFVGGFHGERWVTMRKTITKKFMASIGSLWYGSNCMKYLGPFLGEAVSYLMGEFLVDYEWETLGLSTNPKMFTNNREMEVIHSWWTMLASLGYIFLELLSHNDMKFIEVVWFKVGD